MAQRLKCTSLYQNSLDYINTVASIIMDGVSDRPLHSKTKEPRPKWEDGSIAYTKSLPLNGKPFSRTYDLSKGELPFNAVRPLALKLAIHEIFWIYQDQTSCLDIARKRGIKWWDNHEVLNSGTIGKAYGETVKEYNLINTLLKDMEENPLSRRHIINLWQIPHINYQLQHGGLVPCAYEVIFNIKESYDLDNPDYKLYLESTSNLFIEKPVKRVVNMTLNQRSNDFIVANSINIMQYISLGLKVCGHLTYKTGINYELNLVTHNIYDCHIYAKHEEIYIKALEEYEFALDQVFSFPEECFLELPVNKNFFDYKIEDFSYKKPEFIIVKSKFPVAI